MTQKARRRLIVEKIISDKDFRRLFTGLETQIARIVADPGCQCNSNTIDEIDRRLAGRAVDDSINNDWRVIDCDVSQLEGLLKTHHRHGRRNFAIARDGNNVVCVLNETSGGENG